MTHDSPATVVCSVPWFGVPVTIDHDVPFHSRADVAGEGPEAAAAEPTALHVVWLKQSTAVSPWFRVDDVSGTFEVMPTPSRSRTRSGSGCGCR